MKNRWTGVCLTILIFVSSVFLTYEASNVLGADRRITEQLEFYVDAPEETHGQDTIQVALKVKVPEDVEVYGLQAVLGFNLNWFSCYSENVIAGSLIDRSNISFVSQGIQVIYIDSVTPISAGDYTLMTAEFRVEEDTPEQAYQFYVAVEMAYTDLFDEDDKYIGSEDIPYQTYEANVYVGERFSVSPSKASIYIGDKLAVFYNKTIDTERIVNMQPEILDYDQEKRMITALKQGTGTIIFYTPDGEYASVTVKVLESEPLILRGDLDGDGERTDWDGVLLTRYLAGWNLEFEDMAVLDIDGDGEVTDWDGVLYDRYLAGWDVNIFKTE